MFMLFIATLVLTLGVQMYLRSTYGRWERVANASGLTGADTARAILRANGLHDVKVEAVPGQLTDHYDPRTKTVRLSEAHFRVPSVAGAAVAAHEVGHALQHAKAYGPLQMRAALVPVASIGSSLGPWIVIAGFMLGAAGLIQMGSSSSGPRCSSSSSRCRSSSTPAAAPCWRWSDSASRPAPTSAARARCSTPPPLPTWPPRPPR
jgi:Zn-dependent membrane protease YugP